MMASPRPIACVFSAASEGSNRIYMEAAHDLAVTLHARGNQVVNGGGTKGLMGEVARTMIALGGPGAAQGIMPGALKKHEASAQPGTPTTGVAENEQDRLYHGSLTMTSTLAERMQAMQDRVKQGPPGSGFVVLPGGLGTINECINMATAHQMGVIKVPVVMFNVDGFWTHMKLLLEHCTVEGFVKEGNKNILRYEDSASGVVEALLAGYESPDTLNVDV